MKSLWNLISFMAVVNLLALLMFGGWLWRTERLDVNRIHQMRDMLAMTISEEAAAHEEQSQLDAAVKEAEQEAAWREDPPLPSAIRVDQEGRSGRQDQDAMNRLKSEKASLLKQIDRARDQLAKDQSAFEMEKAAWERVTEDERKRKNDRQFAKTIKNYELLPPEQAKQMLKRLVQDGKMHQVMAYLDAMNQRAVTNILETMSGDPTEEQLATELLENLRTFGTVAEGAEISRNDSSSVPNPSSPTGTSEFPDT